MGFNERDHAMTAPPHRDKARLLSRRDAGHEARAAHRRLSESSTTNAALHCGRDSRDRLVEREARNQAIAVALIRRTSARRRRDAMRGHRRGPKIAPVMSVDNCRHTNRRDSTEGHDPQGTHEHRTERHVRQIGRERLDLEERTCRFLQLERWR